MLEARVNAEYILVSEEDNLFCLINIGSAINTIYHLCNPEQYEKLWPSAPQGSVSDSINVLHNNYDTCVQCGHKFSAASTIKLRLSKYYEE